MRADKKLVSRSVVAAVVLLLLGGGLFRAFTLNRTVYIFSDAPSAKVFIDGYLVHAGLGSFELVPVRPSYLIVVTQDGRTTRKRIYPWDRNSSSPVIAVYKDRVRFEIAHGP